MDTVIIGRLSVGSAVIALALIRAASAAGLDIASTGRIVQETRTDTERDSAHKLEDKAKTQTSRAKNILFIFITSSKSYLDPGNPAPHYLLSLICD